LTLHFRIFGERILCCFGADGPKTTQNTLPKNLKMKDPEVGQQQA